MQIQTELSCGLISRGRRSDFRTLRIPHFASTRDGNASLKSPRKNPVSLQMGFAVPCHAGYNGSR